ncbi:MFS transporter [Rubrobacter tropicus]|uniref:MFS transporter n=1 Tax=Rubrobacter tropicus TaxID=2653851 RepID=A0A6G8Q508_9ACTN|nr:MFS transporter [Rubrobacter tropicus]QIN81540.1 MFS transporter [Rubrobacter tropicus]
MGASRRLGFAGFVATAVTFGPARNGYGLFLPEIREEFGLSTQMLGFIASGLYVGYLAALLAVGLLAARNGPRLPVTIGLLSAGVGMALVAFSHSVTVLAAGVVIAGTAAGWSWAPYNDTVGRTVPAASGDRVLSVISTGTTLGVAVAGLAALAATTHGLPWRTAWFGFAAGALAAAVSNAALLPRGTGFPGNGRAVDRPGLRWFWRPASAPLFVVAFCFGVVNAVYWSFAVDAVSGATGPPAVTGPLLYATLGTSGFAGLLTGDTVARFGLRRTLCVTLVCVGIAAGLLGLAPALLPAVMASAVLFGAGTMFMSALLSLWSSAAFRERPSSGFSAALLFFGGGGVVGPALVGATVGESGLRPAFAFMAALSVATAFIRPKRRVRGPEPREY